MSNALATRKTFNLVQVASATTGTGTLTLGAAVSGYLTPALAGIADGDKVTYSIRDGSASEIGAGTYTASGTTLSRDVVHNSTNSGSAINCSGTQQVRLTLMADDFMYTLGSGDGGLGTTFYLTNTASDIATYYEMPLTFIDGATADVASAALTAATDDQLVAVWATASGVPHSYYINRGTFTFHIRAKKAGGMATTTIYAELYSRTAAAAETLLGRTPLFEWGSTPDTALATSTQDLTGSFFLFRRNNSILAPAREYKGAVTDRLVVKIRANVGAGSGGAVTVTCNGWTNFTAQLDSLYFAERILPAVKAAHLYNNSNFR